VVGVARAGGLVVDSGVSIASTVWLMALVASVGAWPGEVVGVGGGHWVSPRVGAGVAVSVDW
jgi:hypothetical protein